VLLDPLSGQTGDEKATGTLTVADVVDVDSSAQWPGRRLS
jgi:hypothetical protein